MARARRKGSERSATRAILIQAAEALMIEEGYAAVTARKLGARAGLKSMLLHYYFEDMDDLFVSVIRHRGEVGLEQMVKALATDEPLKTVWGYESNEHYVRLSAEFLALAAHRPAVRAEVKRFGEQQRIVQTAAIARHFELNKITSATPPVVYALLLSSLSSSLLLETLNDIDMGHAELEAWVRSLMQGAGGGALFAMWPTGDEPGKAKDDAEAARPPSPASKPRGRTTAAPSRKKKARDPA